MNTLTQDLKELEKLYRTKRKADKAAADADTEYKRKKFEVLERMEDDEVSMQKLNSGTMIQRIEPTILAHIQDKEAFLAWAQEHEEQLLDSEPKPREGLLNALVRDRIDDGEALPPGVGFYPRPNLRVTLKS